TLTGGMSLMYLRSHAYMPGNAAATANAILADVLAYRFAIVGALVSQLAMLFLALELYRVFAPVARTLARVLLVSMAISVALACANQLPNMIALLLLGPEPDLKVFTQAQRETLVLLLLRVQNGVGQGLLEIFWTPFYMALGLLVLRTRALPRVLGLLLVLMGTGFAVNILDKLLAPQLYPAEFTQLAMALGALGALPTMLWLLVRGLALPLAGGVAADA
ncbi:MAG TPA: DUF4386 domain-containing protein, partial [Luteimonas sp.]|nr:DUF4386 domain-containing protein [Luteimonas sp.]